MKHDNAELEYYKLNDSSKYLGNQDQHCMTFVDLGDSKNTRKFYTNSYNQIIEVPLTKQEKLDCIPQHYIRNVRKLIYRF